MFDDDGYVWPLLKIYWTCTAPVKISWNELPLNSSTLNGRSPALSGRMTKCSATAALADDRAFSTAARKVGSSADTGLKRNVDRRQAKPDQPLLPLIC